MASFNRVILAGNVTRDIELRHIPSGMAVCELSLAVNDRRKGANGEVIEEVSFVDCTFWGRTAEVCSEYLQKGSNILVEGRLKQDTWEADGQKRSKLKVVGEKMQMLGGKGEGGTRESSAPKSQGSSRRKSEPDSGSGPADEDIPF